MGTAKGPIKRRRRQAVIGDFGKVLPTGVQKSYFMLSDAERTILNVALEKYRPGQSEPILVGGEKAIKPALRLMTRYRLAIEEIKDSEAITSYTRWVDAVQVKGGDEKEVYLRFSPHFERIWLECTKRLLESAAQKPPHIALRSQYSLRLYAWAKNQLSLGTKRLTLERLRKVLGRDSVKNVAGKVIRKAPLPVWANLRQRALDTAIKDINAKTDLNIAIESIERAAQRRVTALTFAIKAERYSKRNRSG